MDLSKSFIREVECNDCILQICQAEVGDVGCVVWDAALVLAKYIELCHRKNHNDCMTGKKVIELGAGTGVVGLCAAVLGADVTLTDLKEFLPLLQVNIDCNQSTIVHGSVSAATLSWDQDIEQFLPAPDYLLMSDVIYYKEGVDPLIATIRKLTGKHTLVLLSYEDRTLGDKEIILDSFFQTMQKEYIITEISQGDLDQVFRSDDIHVIRLHPK